MFYKVSLTTGARSEAHVESTSQLDDYLPFWDEDFKPEFKIRHHRLSMKFQNFGGFIFLHNFFLKLIWY